MEHGTDLEYCSWKMVLYVEVQLFRESAKKTVKGSFHFGQKSLTPTQGIGLDVILIDPPPGSRRLLTTRKATVQPATSEIRCN